MTQRERCSFTFLQENDKHTSDRRGPTLTQDVEPHVTFQLQVQTLKRKLYEAQNTDLGINDVSIHRQVSSTTHTGSCYYFDF